MINKSQIQESQYHFPYHHLAHEENGAIYIFRHLFWGIEHLSYINFVIEETLKIPFENLLDVGCGEGRIISDLVKRKPNADYHGIDVSDRAIKFAQAFNTKGEFYTHDITKENLNKEFDVIVSCEVIEHIEPAKVPDYIKNIAVSLKSGGHLIITTPTTNVPVNTKHYQHFTLEMFETLLKDSFTISDVVYLNRQSLFSRILSRTIGNRFYLSNSNVLNKLVFNLYKKFFFMCKKDTGSRIFVHATKN